MKEYKEYAVYVDGKYIGRFKALTDIYKYLDKNNMPYYIQWKIEGRTGKVFDFNERA